MNSPEIMLEQVIQSTAETVYRAFTNEAALTTWLCQDARIAAQPHGRLYLYWPQGYYAAGEFETVTPASDLVFSWRGAQEQHSSRVAITLSAVGDGTRVALHHTGLESEAAATHLQALWETGLANLQAVLETGLDNRLYGRPFLGVILQAELTADQAAANGAPHHGAVQLGGTVSGSSAAEAGLQNNDLLTQINGTTIGRFADIGQALQGKQVGDTLPVTIYRQGQAQTAALTLRRRPAPVLPASPAAFAEELQAAYAELDAQLDAILAGATDEAANTPPAPGEWSVREVLAHLLVCERTLQLITGIHINDGVLQTWPNNDPPLLQAVLHTYPTLAELTAAWKRAEAETVALMAHLPAQLVSRKVDYAGLVNLILHGMPAHTAGHLQQIQAALTAAKVAE